MQDFTQLELKNMWNALVYAMILVDKSSRDSLESILDKIESYIEEETPHGDKSSGD